MTNSKESIEGIVREIRKDGLLINIKGKEILLPLEKSGLKQGERVYLNISTEEEERKTKKEIAEELLREVIKNE